MIGRTWRSRLAAPASAIHMPFLQGMIGARGAEPFVVVIFLRREGRR